MQAGMSFSTVSHLGLRYEPVRGMNAVIEVFEIGTLNDRSVRLMDWQNGHTNGRMEEGMKLVDGWIHETLRSKTVLINMENSAEFYRLLFTYVDDYIVSATCQYEN